MSEKLTQLSRRDIIFTLPKAVLISVVMSACNKKPSLTSTFSPFQTPEIKPNTMTPNKTEPISTTSSFTTPSKIFPTITQTSTPFPPTETPDPRKIFSFGDINFYNMSLPSSDLNKTELKEFINNSITPVAVSIQSPEGEIPILPFYPFSYQENIFEGKVFALENETGVVCQGEDYLLIWLHSGNFRGKNLAAGKLQQKLETDKNGNLKTVAEVEKSIALLRDALTLFQQGKTSNYSQIKGAIRIPPNEVNAEENHVLDKLDFLINRYPGYGFENLSGKTNLLISFCGKNLKGEETRKNEKGIEFPYYLQSRFIIGFTLI